MKKFLILALGFLFALPCALRAEEVEILLTEVIHVGFIPGDDPLDGPGQSQGDPPSPTSFRATINGHALAITKQEPTIPSAQATVVNASTGSIVLNQQFTSSIQQGISNSGVYVLHITTAGGALVGQFIVQ